MAFNISSTAFESGKSISAKNTCDGDDISPQLYWDEVPKDAVTLALIMEDPDAPGGTFTHWILYNIPPNTKGLDANISQQKTLKDSSIQGENDFNRYGYGGPCPPKGEEHRYFFRLFALNKKLMPGSANGREEFYQAIKGNTIAEAEYMGLYKRNR